jgi:hypothetical protein
VSSLDRNSLDIVWRDCFCSRGIRRPHTCWRHFGSSFWHATGSCHLPVLLQVWPCLQSLARPKTYSWGYYAPLDPSILLGKEQFRRNEKDVCFCQDHRRGKQNSEYGYDLSYCSLRKTWKLV